DRLEGVLACAVEQAAEELVAVTAASPARHDCNRELGCLLVDEPKAGVLACKQAVPGRADRHELVEDDQRAVARAAPVVDVAGERRLLLTHGSPPVEGVEEEAAGKREVSPDTLSVH